MNFDFNITPNLYGKKIGVISIFQANSVASTLTVFKFDGKQKLELESHIENPSKKHVRKIDTAIINYISQNPSVRHFDLKDSIEKNLYQRVIENNRFYNSINSNIGVINCTFPEEELNELIAQKNKLIKDHHFEVYNFIGIEIIKKHQNDLWERIKRSIELDQEFTLDDKVFNKKSLNSLGIIAGLLIYQNISFPKSGRIEVNILKDFAKRRMLKVLPVILILLIGNYFFFNFKNDELFGKHRELKSIQLLLGDQTLQNAKKDEILKYYSEIKFPLQLDRPYLMNELIKASIEGIEYQKISFDTENKNGNSDYGEASIIFTLNDSALIDKWMNAIQNENRIISINLDKLEKNYTGLLHGELKIRYKK